MLYRIYCRGVCSKVCCLTHLSLVCSLSAFLAAPSLAMPVGIFREVPRSLFAENKNQCIDPSKELLMLPR